MLLKTKIPAKHSKLSRPTSWKAQIVFGQTRETESIMDAR